MMTEIVDIRKDVAPELEQLNALIANVLQSDNRLLNLVVDSYLSHKGKQLRPILLILTARLLGGDMPKSIIAAASVELLHNASLIHDDVVDESNVRHSHATINSAWDNQIAVLVGDYFVSHALQLATRTDDIRVIKLLGDLGASLTVGEMDQIVETQDHVLDEDTYMRIISHKTASLFETCVKMGCYCADVVPGDREFDAVVTFATLFGICFQIRDDIFDYFPQDLVGKPTRNDLREGKITLPLIYAFSQATPREHKRMLDLAVNEEITAADIETLTQFAIMKGGIDYAYLKMRKLRDQAVYALSIFDPDKAAPLISLFDHVIERKF